MRRGSAVLEPHLPWTLLFASVAVSTLHPSRRLRPSPYPIQISNTLSESKQIEGVLVSVWRQTLIEGVKSVQVGAEHYPVRATSKRRLKQVDFKLEGHEIRGLEQNPLTKSRWALLARKGSKVMQFLEHGRYVAVVVDGKAHNYQRIV